MVLMVGQCHWAHRVSLCDYVMCTLNLFQHVKTFEVSDPNILTDHCLIYFTLDFDKHDSNEQNDGCIYDR